MRTFKAIVERLVESAKALRLCKFTGTFGMDTMARMIHTRKMRRKTGIHEKHVRINRVMYNYRIT